MEAAARTGLPCRPVWKVLAILVWCQAIAQILEIRPSAEIRRDSGWCNGTRGRRDETPRYSPQRIGTTSRDQGSWRSSSKASAESTDNLQTLRYEDTEADGDKGPSQSPMAGLEGADEERCHQATATVRERQASIDAEITALQTQGEEAAQEMHSLVLNGPAAMDTDVQEGAQRPSSEAWDEIAGQTGADPPVLDFMRQAFAYAQLAHQQQRGGRPAAIGQMGLGVMPPQIMEQLAGCPPPSFGRPPEQVHARPQEMSGSHGVPMPTGGPPQTGPQEIQTTEAPSYTESDISTARMGPYSRSPMAGGMGTDNRNPSVNPAVPEPRQTSGQARVMEADPLLTATAAPAAPAQATARPGSAPVLRPVPLPHPPDETPASPLVDQLRQRRQEARRAMEPFGGRGAAAPVAAATEQTNTDHTEATRSGPFPGGRRRNCRARGECATWQYLTRLWEIGIASGSLSPVPGKQSGETSGRDRLEGQGSTGPSLGKPPCSKFPLGQCPFTGAHSSAVLKDLLSEPEDCAAVESCIDFQGTSFSSGGCLTEPASNVLSHCPYRP